MEQEMVHLKQFERDSEWFHNHIGVLRKMGLTEKFVAIKNSKPLFSDKKIDVVIKRLEEKGENPSFIFIEFVHPAGYILLL